jgi:hypothetical protein
MDRVRVIEQSLRCYLAGWWSLIPIIGLLPAVIAVCLYLSVRNQVEDQWNPASAYLWKGILLAMTGVCVSLLLIGGALIQHLF